jgi:hypothetical protein
MEKPTKDSIQKATQRVMKKIPLGKMRLVPKYKNITEKDYLKLIKNSEKLVLLILELYLVNNDLIN